MNGNGAEALFFLKFLKNFVCSFRSDIQGENKQNKIHMDSSSISSELFCDFGAEVFCLLFLPL